MVMEISIEPIEEDRFDNTYRCFAYTVRADHHRILTLHTSSDQTLSKWINDVLKSSSKDHHSPILVAIIAENRTTEYTKRGASDLPYELITLCVGSQCLIYFIHEPLTYRFSGGAKQNPRILRDFLENPRVVAVGMEMETMAKKLERHHGIKVRNAVDLRRMAVQGLKEGGEKLDLWRYDLDKLAKTVLGKHVDVVRPEEKVEWYWDDDDMSYCLWWLDHHEMSLEKVQFNTIDAYLGYLVGSELHERMMILGKGGGGTDQDSCKSKKNETKKKKMMMMMMSYE